MKVNRMQRSKVALLLVLVSLATIASGCDGENQQDIIRALMASCGEHTVFLNAWWSNVDDQSQIEMDPMGGYIYLYWIDEDGCVCHGDPGVSGQPGPELVLAFIVDVYDIANEYAEISPSQLDQFQVIPFDLGSYAAEGLHFAQFANWFWRIRDDGKVFRDTPNSRSSIPEIVSLNMEFCLLPIYAYGQPGCQSIGMPIPSPSDLILILSDGSGQHPDKCMKRVMPDTFSLSVSERLNYCLLSLTDGSD